MKVGLRLGQCMIDIITGKVLLTEVLVIVSNSKLNPKKDEHWDLIWKNYYHDSKLWDIGYHEEVFKYTLRRLYDMGKIHQPKIYGGRPHGFAEAWVDIIPTLTKEVPRGITYPELATMPDILL